MVCYEALKMESRYHLPFRSYSDLNERNFYNNFNTGSIQTGAYLLGTAKSALNIAQK